MISCEQLRELHKKEFFTTTVAERLAAAGHVKACPACREAVFRKLREAGLTDAQIRLGGLLMRPLIEADMSDPEATP
jgi:hypothetical protein